MCNLNADGVLNVEAALAVEVYLFPEKVTCKWHFRTTGVESG